MSTEAVARPALTMLTEEEEMFRDAVREFARGQIRPLSAEMDRSGRYDESLIKSLFEMGVMGVEVSEAHGGAGGNFFQAILANSLRISLIHCARSGGSTPMSFSTATM